MPSKIQAFPVGIQDLFGVKSLGKNPDILPDEVLSTVDLTEFYLANRQEQIEGTNNGETLAGQAVQVNMPNDEIWLMRNIAATVQVPSAIGAIMNIAVLYMPPGGNRQVLAQSPRHVATSNNASEMTSAQVQFERPRIFLPATRFDGRLIENVGGALTVQTRITFTFVRLSI